MSILSLFKNKFNASKVLVYPDIEKVSKYNAYLANLYEGENTGNEQLDSIDVKGILRYIFTLRTTHELFHVHWIGVSGPKSLIATSLVILLSIKFKLSGKKVIWTVHNKYPHNNKLFRLNRLIDKLFAKYCNGLHVHGKSAIKEMSCILDVDESKFFVFPHPNYKVTNLSKNDARKILLKKYKLSLPENNTVLLLPGIVSEYKMTLETINLIVDCPDILSKSFILIVGKNKCNSGTYSSEIKKIVSQNFNIFWFDLFVSDDEMDAFHYVSDMVIFNYKDILTSGGVIRSLNCKIKTIAPRQGCIQDIDDNNLYIFDLNPVDSIKKAIANNETYKHISSN